MLGKKINLPQNTIDTNDTINTNHEGASINYVDVQGERVELNLTLGIGGLDKYQVIFSLYKAV